ncbi:EamA family transporter [Barrientosiimonas endolithica]|uniref:Membrane protein n=1 Tax=Barrientosiimonas endolithica TaxID=1535208 RepID=A0ABM8HB48_9MICO|nr:EamA family transporter [Barrientosiimonas endolithica]BDZ58178.1 membrane protein [Barrientosiimonas endolithica]
MTEPAPGDQRRALLLVLIAVGSVQLGGALAATLIPEVGVVGSVALRIAIGAALLLAWARPRLRGRSRSDWVAVATYAGVLTLMNLTFYASLERLPIGVAVTIEFIGPLTLALVLSRRATDLLGVAAAAAGVVLVSGAVDTSWSELDLVGIALALTAGACWAGYILASRRVGVRFEQIDGLALGLALSTLVMVPLGAITAGGSLLQGEVLLKGLGIAILSSALPYSLELVALRTLRPNVFGILLSLEPAAAALAGLLVLGQTLSAVRIAGMLLVVAASAVVLGRRQTPQDARSVQA